MKWALVGLFWLFLVKNSQSFGLVDDDDDCGDVYDTTFCSEQNTFHDHECSEVCSNQEFEKFLTTAPEIGNFKKCCDGDIYSFPNNCDDEGAWNNRKDNPRLCGAQGTISNMSFTCPEGCIAYYGVNGNQLDLNAAQGTVDLKSGQKQLASISDSCATYECHMNDDYYEYGEQTSNSESEDGYKMVFHICVCPKKEGLEEDIKTNFQNPKVKQCCPESHITVVDKRTLKCFGDHATQPNQDLRICQESFEEEIWDPQMTNDTHFKLNGKEFEIEAEQFCIGQTPNTFASEFNPEFNSERDLIQHTLFHCPSPCTVGKPCLRTCCPNHKKGKLCDGPEANPDNYTMWKNLDPDVKTYSVHLQPSYSPTEHRLEYLYQSKCSQQFDLTRSGSEVLLRMRKTEKVYQPHEFCVNFQSDGTLAAIVANRLEDQSEETNVTVKSELDEQFGCLQTSMVEVTARLMKLTDMREGIVFQFGDAEVALKQETNAYFENQNAEMTERFEKLVQSYSLFLKSKFEEQALNMTQHAN